MIPHSDDKAVSVIIPTHNRADLLCRAVRSCLDQLACLEVVVVDDGSDEPVEAALRDAFQRAMAGDAIPRLLCIRQEHQGACSARNLGLSKATGACVKFLDSDDELLPDTLAKELACFEQHDVDVVVTGWKEQRYRPDGTPVPGTEKFVSAPELGRGIDDMLLGNGPWTSAALYKRSFIQDLRWDPAWTKAQDWGWSLTVCLAGAKYASLDIPSAIYKHHDGARITSDGDRLLRSSLARQQMLNMIEEKLVQQEALTQERRNLLARYYYRDRIVLCQHSPQMWIACWRHCLALDPAFKPAETQRIVRWFTIVLGVSYGVRAYVMMKCAVKGHRCLSASSHAGNVYSDIGFPDDETDAT